MAIKKNHHGKSKRPVAVACTDLHLSQTPPIARAGEPDWFAAMRRPLKQLCDIKERYEVSVLCAGDIFDRWQAPPELINFAIENLPGQMYVVPGQHDLPYHSSNALDRSALGTLVRAGKVQILDNQNPVQFPIPDTDPSLAPRDRYIWVYGFGWGKEVAPPVNATFRNIAVVHAYTWINGCGYKDAPEERRVSKAMIEKYRGYSAAIIGDNHKSWDYEECATYFWNGGGFMRRNSDQASHRPRVGLLYADGKVETIELDCTEDILLTAPGGERDIQAAQTLVNLREQLRNLQASDLDYKAALRREMNRRKTPDSVRALLEAALGNG